jgi:hypothetical protein
LTARRSAFPGTAGLAHPLAISVRHSGRRESRHDLLSPLFGALLIAGPFYAALGQGWQSRANQHSESLDEVEACQRALGLLVNSWPAGNSTGA